MALLGKGVLAIWNGIEPEAEEEFLRWHVHEHIPERVALPGFLRGRRYVAVDGTPKYFNFYETSQPADLVSQAYRTELDRPSEWTRSVVRSFTDTSRTICEVARSSGLGEGVFVEALRLETPLEAADFRRRLDETVLPSVAGSAEVVGVHLLEGQRGKGNGETAETRLRGGSDEVASWVLLVETVRSEAVEYLRRDLLCEEKLADAGAAAVRRGLYALQFSLAKSELETTGRAALPRRDRRPA